MPQKIGLKGREMNLFLEKIEPFMDRVGSHASEDRLSCWTNCLQQMKNFDWGILPY
jgi:hypothetical protein